MIWNIMRSRPVMYKIRIKTTGPWQLMVKNALIVENEFLEFTSEEFE